MSVVAIDIDRQPRGWEFLSRAECARAARFRSPRARAEFVTVRAALREVLARLCEEPAERLVIVTDDRGKPRLAHGGPHFSVSHTRGLGLIALAVDREVGVDVELIDVGRVNSDLERRVLAARERRGADLPAEQRAVEFFRRWACKEALVKASGEGIGSGLERLAISDAALAGRPAPPDMDQAGAGVTVAAIEAGPLYAAAVAAVGADWQARICRC